MRKFLWLIAFIFIYVIGSQMTPVIAQVDGNVTDGNLTAVPAFTFMAATNEGSAVCVAPTSATGTYNWVFEYGRTPFGFDDGIAIIAGGATTQSADVFLSTQGVVAFRETITDTQCVVYNFRTFLCPGR